MAVAWKAVILYILQVSNEEPSEESSNIMHKRKGFTLIELLVVISIIALLMAILMPTLQRVKKQARAVVCQSNLRQWGLYFAMYTQDNDGHFQSGWWPGIDFSGTWVPVLRPYYRGSEEILCCPEATKPLTEGGRQPFAAWGVYDSGVPAFEGLCGSYGINAWVRNPPWKTMPERPTRPAKKNWRSPNVKGAWNVPLLLGHQYYAGYPQHYNQPPEYEGQSWQILGGEQWMAAYCLNRHNGFVNGVFLDWSVRKIGLKELWKLKWHRHFDTGALPPVWPEWMRRLKDY